MDLVDIRKEIAKMERMISLLEMDVIDARRWERYESGHETRDVLEHGERRIHLERRLGRKATHEDVQMELSRTWNERRIRSEATRSLVG